MKKAFILFFSFMIIFSCKTEKDSSISYTPNNYRNLPLNKNQQVILDLSAVFDASETDILTKKLIDYNIKSTNQIALLTVDSIKPYNNIQKYASDIGNYWGVGSKKKNNGLIIVLCNPCRQIAISTGYGTEHVITDSISKNIIEKTMIPKFKENYYFDGINDALDSIIRKWK